MQGSSACGPASKDARQRIEGRAHRAARPDEAETQGEAPHKAPKRNHRRRQRRGKKSDVKLPQAAERDAQLKSWMLTMSKQVAMLSQRSRLLSSVILSTTLIPTINPIMTAIENAAEDFAAHVEVAKQQLAEAQKKNTEEEIAAAKLKLQQIGPPAPTLWAAMLEALLRETTISAPTRAVLEQQVSLFESEVPAVKVCKVEPCYDEAVKKLIFAHDDREVTQIVERALASTTGARITRGHAPPGAWRRYSRLDRSPICLRSARCALGLMVRNLSRTSGQITYFYLYLSQVPRCGALYAWEFLFLPRGWQRFLETCAGSLADGVVQFQRKCGGPCVTVVGCLPCIALK